ncbi:enoyl-CoA hydratase/isomerase family protein [Actinomadura decatromicini]|uniref:Enoyl-CoA hydratase/isomerase family protein n=1 Tax=Actinomadura decatromicini TaxID=2604572 RepID=A0A5D3F8B5_9ACTN|nr:enoyl-CoA hydratase-related protein [Actinomadura decatromicini]TYK44443.1 enoyl-CoA hydratase/isomerase family protein [Actinomadura decatromicini]
MTAVLTERYGSVLLVTLNRPEVLNAVDDTVVEGMALAWREAADPAVRAVVLTGAGRGFCAGADLKAGRRPDAARPAGGLRATFNADMLAMAALEKPVIAAVNGPAAGFGLSLACAADLRIASHAARFVPAFADIGLVPDGGGSYYLARLLGYARAFELLTTGRRLTAAEALDWGLVTEVVEPVALVPRTLDLAARLADRPGLAVPLTKRLLAGAARAHLAEQLEEEARAQEAALGAPGRAAARAAKIDEMKR